MVNPLLAAIVYLVGAAIFYVLMLFIIYKVLVCLTRSFIRDVRK